MIRIEKNQPWLIPALFSLLTAIIYLVGGVILGIDKAAIFSGVQVEILSLFAINNIGLTLSGAWDIAFIALPVFASTRLIQRMKKEDDFGAGVLASIVFSFVAGFLAFLSSILLTDLNESFMLGLKINLLVGLSVSFLFGFLFGVLDEGFSNARVFGLGVSLGSGILFWISIGVGFNFGVGLIAGLINFFATGLVFALGLGAISGVKTFSKREMVRV